MSDEFKILLIIVSINTIAFLIHLYSVEKRMDHIKVLLRDHDDKLYPLYPVEDQQ